MYGQYIFYGLENDNTIDFARVCIIVINLGTLLYFKKSSDLGDINQQFYVSLLTCLNLDGSYNIDSNLETESQLYRYVKGKYQSISMVDLYFSTISGLNKSSIAMGYRHLKDIGVNQNCSNSVLFYLPILEDFANSPIKAKYTINNRQVAKVLYDSNFYMNHELDIFGHAQIFENLNLITYDSATEKPNYELAFDILNKIETKNQEYQGKIYNALGYIYFKGLGIQQDILKAQDYFRKAADLQNNDGQFNLGSYTCCLLLFKRERNQLKGVLLFEQAAATGHGMAQYCLALILLDGVDLFYSCDLAASLLHAFSSRRPWTDTLKTANFLFQQENILKQGILDLLQQYNAAVVMEQNDAFYYHTLLQNRLNNDPVYKINGANNDAFGYLYSDYVQLINWFQYKNSKYINKFFNQLPNFLMIFGMIQLVYQIIRNLDQFINHEMLNNKRNQEI